MRKQIKTSVGNDEKMFDTADEFIASLYKNFDEKKKHN